MAIPILIVDDSEMSRKVMSRSLPQNMDFVISEAANGMEALSAWREGKGDIIFLDLTMPVMDGYTTLEKMNAEGMNSFVVVVSADVQPKAEERALRLGAKAFLKKPVDRGEIEDILKKYGQLK